MAMPRMLSAKARVRFLKIRSPQPYDGFFLRGAGGWTDGAGGGAVKVALIDFSDALFFLLSPMSGRPRGSHFSYGAPGPALLREDGGEGFPGWVNPLTRAAPFCRVKLTES